MVLWKFLVIVLVIIARIRGTYRYRARYITTSIFIPVIIHGAR